MAKITLYENYPFDNSYKDTRLFDTRAEQVAYFNNLPKTVVEDVTFSYGTLITTRFNYDFVNQSITSHLMNYNYLSVENEENENDTILYYFIVDTLHYDSGNVEFTLELDVMQTYLIDLNFDKCLIRRAHLDRYIDNGDGTVSFKADKNSPFFKPEPLNFTSQYLVNRYELWQYDNSIVSQDVQGQQQILRYLHNNDVNGYVYIFVDSNHTFNFGDPEGVSPPTYKPEYQYSQEKAISNDYSVFVVPINRAGNKIQITHDSVTYNFDFQEFYELLTRYNQGGSFIFDIIISPVAPFWLTYESFLNPPNNDFNLSANATQHFIFLQPELHPNQAVMVDPKEYLNNDNYNRNVGLFTNFDLTKIKINKSDIYSNNPKRLNPKYEPKLYNSQYSKATLCNFGKETYDYDYLALQQNFKNVTFYNKNYVALPFLVTTSIQPSQCVAYARVQGDENSLYNENTEYNLNGIVSNQLMTLPVVTTAFQQQMAEKKNFITQALLNTVSEGVQNMNNALASPFSAAQGAGLLGSFVGMIAGGINTALTVDNLKNAPSSLKNSSNAFQFNLSYTTYNPYLEIWQLSPKEQNELVDFVSLYGYAYNEIDYPTNYFKSRMYYNFIQFIPTNFGLGENMSAQLSNTIKQRIESIFTNGIRLWHVNTINFDNENPEKSIEWSTNI